MIFTELRFLAFFALVFAVHWALRGLVARKVWLTAASYFFYGCWDWRFLSLILASTVVDWFAGKHIAANEDQAVRKRWLMLSLVANIGLLATFKYLGFFVDSAVDLCALAGIDVARPTLEIVLPVGISFYTFQTLSYSLDIYYRRLEPARSFLDLAFFVAFFPQLVAGPIVRARDFLPQLARGRRFFEHVPVRECAILFFVGYFKKGVVSDNISPLADRFFTDPTQFDAFGAWAALLCFSVQLYCDFSGYSDMAIACAGLLGYQLCLNFDYPYFSPNLRHFWRRWHVSLSSWFNDYVYIPLGGSRGPRWFAYRNTFLSMLLAGLWHGPAWNFVLWGAYHGIALVVYQEIWRWRGGPEPSQNPLLRFISTAFTFWVVAVSMVFFRAADMTNFSESMASLFTGAGSGRRELGGWIPYGLFAGLGLLHWAGQRKIFRGLLERTPNWAFAMGCGAVAALLLAFMNANVRPFIYFQF